MQFPQRYDNIVQWGCKLLHFSHNYLARTVNHQVDDTNLTHTFHILCVGSTAAESHLLPAKLATSTVLFFFHLFQSLGCFCCYGTKTAPVGLWIEMNARLIQ